MFEIKLLDFWQIIQINFNSTPLVVHLKETLFYSKYQQIRVFCHNNLSSTWQVQIGQLCISFIRCYIILNSIVSTGLCKSVNHFPWNWNWGRKHFISCTCITFSHTLFSLCLILLSNSSTFFFCLSLHLKSPAIKNDNRLDIVAQQHFESACTIIHKSILNC